MWSKERARKDVVKTFGLPAKGTEARKQYDYLWERRRFMRYDECRKLQLFIGAGKIQAVRANYGAIGANSLPDGRRQCGLPDRARCGNRGLSPRSRRTWGYLANAVKKLTRLWLVYLDLQTSSSLVFRGVHTHFHARPDQGTSRPVDGSNRRCPHFGIFL